MAEITYSAFKNLESETALTFYKAAILTGLQGKSPLYQGTVTAKVKAKRRAKDKVARASRRANRG